MTGKSARKLLVGAIVMWEGNPNDLGTVREIGRWGVLIDWQNGETVWRDFRDMQQVSVR
jgi:hypothetical protein